MKYAPEQLRQPARQALEAKQAGDIRYKLLLLKLDQRTGLHTIQCELQICLLADAR